MSSSAPAATHRQLDERQVILRLPPTLATQVQRQLDNQLTNGQQELELPYQIEFLDNRHALFYCDGKKYGAVLLDLPCVVESSRFGDAKKIYKNLDIHQVLQVEPTPREEAVEKTETEFCLEDGITHVTKGAKTRFRKDPPEYGADRVSYVEGMMKNVFELKYNLTKGDSTKKTDTMMEFLEEEELEDTRKEPPMAGSEEVVEATKSTPPRPPQESPNMEESPVNTVQVEDVPQTNNLPEPDASAHFVEDAETFNMSPPNVSDEKVKSEPVLESPQEDNLSIPPSSQVDVVEQQKVLEAQRKAERFKIEQSIEAQHSKIRQMEEKIRDVSNRALKQRMQQRLDDLNQELAQLEASLDRHEKESNIS